MALGLAALVLAILCSGLTSANVKADSIDAFCGKSIIREQPLCKKLLRSDPRSLNANTRVLAQIILDNMFLAVEDVQKVIGTLGKPAESCSRDYNDVLDLLNKIQRVLKSFDDLDGLRSLADIARNLIVECAMSFTTIDPPPGHDTVNLPPELKDKGGRAEDIINIFIGGIILLG